MKVTEFEIKGPKLIEMPSFGDARGFFVERFHEERFREIGLDVRFVQDNYSRSQRGILRGLHYQYERPQAKLVTAASGVIFDVAVDIRAHSPTFGQSITVELSGDRPAWFWVPEGFAHGFMVVSPEGADVLYKVNSYYNPKGEGGIRWDDADLQVPWPKLEDQAAPQISGRDENLMSFADYRKDPRF